MKRLNYALFTLTAFFIAVGMVGLNAQDITHPASGTSNFTVTAGTTVGYFDSGGQACNGEGGAYGNNEDGVAVICPDVAGSTITIEFLDVDVETRGTPACWDFMTIHDGNSTGDPVLFNGCGEDGFPGCSSLAGDGSDGGATEAGPNDINGSNDGNPANNIFTSSAGNGCLTVSFDSDTSVPQGGWDALASASAVGGGPTCMDGIQNGDEEGVDCGGSNCPPCGGGGPTCMDGIQNGDEEGVDCGGSNCPPCEAACEEFTVNINFDNFASETSWEIVNINGSLAESNSYSSAQNGSSTSETYCLEAGCYEFTIFDSFGDGICCGFGMGDYSLEDADGNVLGSGGAFGSEETTFFCTDPGPDCVAPTATASVINYCSNGVFMVAVTLSDLGSANTVVIGNNGGVPMLQNVFFPRTYYVGPFSVEDEVDIFIYDSENSACITVLDDLSSNCEFVAPEGPTTGETFGDINVFPNPTTGQVNVNLASFMGQSANIRILNAVGQTVELRQVNEVQSSIERFDLSQQQSGMYFIHVDVEGQDSFVQRVVLGSARP
jgi:hypothetical protein